MDSRRVGDVEHLDAERVGIVLDQIGDLSRVANGSDDAIAPRQDLLGELAAESAAHASDKPGALCHFQILLSLLVLFLRAGSAHDAVTSSMARNPFSVRG